MYDKQRYIIRQQANTIRRLEDQLARLRAERKEVVVEKSVPMFPVMYDHYISVWKKYDRVKVKVTLTPCFLKVDHEDSYGWVLMLKFCQKSMVPLHKRYSYIL